MNAERRQLRFLRRPKSGSFNCQSGGSAEKNYQSRVKGGENRDAGGDSGKSGRIEKVILSKRVSERAVTASPGSYINCRKPDKRLLTDQGGGSYQYYIEKVGSSSPEHDYLPKSVLPEKKKKRRRRKKKKIVGDGVRDRRESPKLGVRLQNTATSRNGCY